MKKSSLEFTLLFRLHDGILPPLERQFSDLWRFAKILESKGLSIDQWYPAAPTEKESMAHKAFDEAGPTPAALNLARSNNSDEPAFSTVGVWNGIEDSNGMVFTTLLGPKSICKFSFSAEDVSALSYYSAVADLVEGMVKIWPAVYVGVAPFKYGIRDMMVFPGRLSVGWMLYLPHEVSQDQVPEAHMLRYVTDLNGHKGTIIISEIDGEFDANNKDHVHVANKIELRLADRGMLPKYADL